MGSNTPSASFGGITNSRIGVLMEPSAPPNPDLDMASAVTDKKQINQKKAGEPYMISRFGIMIRHPVPRPVACTAT